MTQELKQNDDPLYRHRSAMRLFKCMEIFNKNKDRSNFFKNVYQLWVLYSNNSESLKELLEDNECWVYIVRKYPYYHTYDKKIYLLNINNTRLENMLFSEYLQIYQNINIGDFIRQFVTKNKREAKFFKKTKAIRFLKEIRQSHNFMYSIKSFMDMYIASMRLELNTNTDMNTANIKLYQKYINSIKNKTNEIESFIKTNLFSELDTHGDILPGIIPKERINEVKPCDMYKIFSYLYAHNPYNKKMVYVNELDKENRFKERISIDELDKESIALNECCVCKKTTTLFSIEYSTFCCSLYCQTMIK